MRIEETSRLPSCRCTTHKFSRLRTRRKCLPPSSRRIHALIRITYDTVGELTGIAGDTARQYAQRGQFDPRNISSVLCWVNARRQRLGLQMIGVPDGDNQDDARTTTSAPALPEMEMGAILVYDSRRGCFQGGSDE